MISPIELRNLMYQANTGDIPPHGSLEESDELIAFPFALIRDERGRLMAPGQTNIALADFILGHEILRTMPMTLTDEFAMVIHKKNRRLSDQIDVVGPKKGRKGNKYETHKYVQDAAPRITERGARSLAVVAFRHHLPRAERVVLRNGFKTMLPDLREVGDFEPRSSQPWTRDRELWIRRENKVMIYFAARGWI